MKSNETDDAGGTYWEQERCIESFGGETEKTTKHGRPRDRWDNDIKMEIQEMG